MFFIMFRRHGIQNTEMQKKKKKKKKKILLCDVIASVLYIVSSFMWKKKSLRILLN